MFGHDVITYYVETVRFRAEQKMSSIMSWENTKKATVEAKLRAREVCPAPALSCKIQSVLFHIS
jgi:hypothetical protein